MCKTWEVSFTLLFYQITPGGAQLSLWPLMSLSGSTCPTLPWGPTLLSYSVSLSSSSLSPFLLVSHFDPLSSAPSPPHPDPADDHLLLLCSSLQWQVFEEENRAAVRLLAGDNVEISRSLDPCSFNQFIPVDNFLHCRSEAPASCSGRKTVRELLT